MKEICITEKELEYINIELTGLWRKLVFSSEIIEWMKSTNEIEKYPSIEICETLVGEPPFIEQIGKPLE